MINVPSFSPWNGRLFGKCDFDYWTSFRPLFLLSQMSCTEKVEKCASMRGRIIVDDNDDYNDGGRKRRATSIEHCLHSIEQIGSAPLLVSRLHAWTRKCGPSLYITLSVVRGGIWTKRVKKRPMLLGQRSSRWSRSSSSSGNSSNIRAKSSSRRARSRYRDSDIINKSYLKAGI